jgi:hypothetical protein
MKSKTYNPLTAHTYSLNNRGDRVVSVDSNGNHETLPFSPDNGKTIKNKSVCYWQQLGNFAFPVVRIKGDMATVYPDSDVEPKFYSEFRIKYPQNNP